MTSVTRSRVVPGTSVTIAREAPDQRVEQARLADVGFADDRDAGVPRAPGGRVVRRPASDEVRAHQLVEGAAPIRRARRSDSPPPEKSTDASSRAIRSNSDGVDFGDRFGQRALELIERGARLQRRHGVDQIGDGFRLRQIDPAVEKRTKRELAGLSEAGAAAHRRRDDCRQNDRTAVRAELDDVLAGVGMRRRKKCRDDLVARRRCGANVAWRGSRGRSRRDQACARSSSCLGPLRRTTPMPPRPGGVATATMVSLVENIRLVAAGS